MTDTNLKKKRKTYFIVKSIRSLGTQNLKGNSKIPHIQIKPIFRMSTQKAFYAFYPN